MKLIAKNNEILKFIKDEILKSKKFDCNKKTYSHDMILESKVKNYIYIVELMMKCEEKFNININAPDFWNIKTPIDLYFKIQKNYKK